MLFFYVSNISQGSLYWPCSNFCHGYIADTERGVNGDFLFALSDQNKKKIIFYFSLPSNLGPSPEPKNEKYAKQITSECCIDVISTIIQSRRPSVDHILDPEDRKTSGQFWGLKLRTEIEDWSGEFQCMICDMLWWCDPSPCPCEFFRRLLDPFLTVRFGMTGPLLIERHPNLIQGRNRGERSWYNIMWLRTQPPVVSQDTWY